MFSLSFPYIPKKASYVSSEPKETDILVDKFLFSDLIVNADGVVRSDLSLLRNLESISAKNPFVASQIESLYKPANQQDLPFTSDEDRLAYLRSRYAQDPTELAAFINSLPEEIKQELQDESNNTEDKDVTNESGADTTES